jgi:hypothetical protein
MCSFESLIWWVAGTELCSSYTEPSTNNNMDNEVFCEGTMGSIQTP